MLTASQETLERLHENVAAFWCDDSRSRCSIAVLEGPPDALHFLREFVSPSRPCLIRNALRQGDDDSAVPLYATLDDLVHSCPDLELQVDVTPDGHGDCVRRVALPLEDPRLPSDAASRGPNTCTNQPSSEVRDVFVKPLTMTMTMRQFRGRLCGNASAIQPLPDDTALTDYCFADRVFEVAVPAITESNDMSSSASGVVYYSRQNDCLRRELAPLADLAPAGLPFAEAAFGTGPPDAINMWIGNELAVSSWHRDPYENLFYVLSGTKVFHLCPPADAAVLKARPYDSGSFVLDRDGIWRVRMDAAADGPVDGRVRWISSDPTVAQPSGSILSYCHVMTVHVHAGEMLYLPSLWFHQVTQTCETLAINYWYDMRFDAKWCYFSFLEELRITESARNEEGE